MRRFYTVAVTYTRNDIPEVAHADFIHIYAVSGDLLINLGPDALLSIGKSDFSKSICTDPAMMRYAAEYAEAWNIPVSAGFTVWLAGGCRSMELPISASLEIADGKPGKPLGFHLGRDLDAAREIAESIWAAKSAEGLALRSLMLKRGNEILAIFTGRWE